MSLVSPATTIHRSIHISMAVQWFSKWVQMTSRGPWRENWTTAVFPIVWMQTACTIIEDKGSHAFMYLTSCSFSTGHVFNMPHDNVKACTDVFGKLQDNHMMSPTLIQINRTSPWSPCSAAIITEFLDSGHGEFPRPLTHVFDYKQSLSVMEEVWSQSEDRHKLLSKMNSTNLTHQSLFTGLGELYCICEKKLYKAFFGTRV